jgi:hypothetical protein
MLTCIAFVRGEAGAPAKRVVASLVEGALSPGKCFCEGGDSGGSAAGGGAEPR